MTSFARDFVSSIEGTSLDISTKELSGGARIYYIFNDVFGHALSSLDPTGNLSTQDIRTAIRNSHGPRPSMFVPEIAFDLLVKPQIKLLEAPSLRCVELVYEELVRICHNCTSKELARFPKLHTQLIETVSELLRERLGPTSEYAQSLIDIQAAYINTNHPGFMRSDSAVMGMPDRSRKPKRSEKPTRVRHNYQYIILALTQTFYVLVQSNRSASTETCPMMWTIPIWSLPAALHPRPTPSILGQPTTRRNTATQRQHRIPVLTGRSLGAHPPLQARM